jgi:hypothetical protein
MNRFHKDQIISTQHVTAGGAIRYKTMKHIGGRLVEVREHRDVMGRIHYKPKHGMRSGHATAIRAHPKVSRHRVMDEISKSLM